MRRAKPAGQPGKLPPPSHTPRSSCPHQTKPAPPDQPQISILDLDIFTRMKGRSLEDFRPRLGHLETGGVRIPYLSPAELVFLKEGSWREKDKLDVQAMREIIARERR